MGVQAVSDVGSVGPSSSSLSGVVCRYVPFDFDSLRVAAAHMLRRLGRNQRARLSKVRTIILRSSSEVFPATIVPLMAPLVTG